MIKYALFNILFLVVIILPVSGQEKIDGEVAFQSDPAKRFSLYIPSSYEEGQPSPAFICFHPLNTRRWDARSWRDTLTTFAEDNGLILICPDGGTDGRIDDPIDTAFTTYLRDSLTGVYSLDTDAIYAMGFSWGGRATYTYGLRRMESFAGLMIIGAAINGLSEVGGLTSFALDKNVAIIHGSNDSPGVRFYPVRDALVDDGACVFDTLMSGVGHTIDFPGRNDLLAQGYNFLRENRCGATTYVREDERALWKIQSPLSTGVVLGVPDDIIINGIWDMNGARYVPEGPLRFDTEGIYIIHYMNSTGQTRTGKIVVSGN